MRERNGKILKTREPGDAYIGLVSMAPSLFNPTVLWKSLLRYTEEIVNPTTGQS